MMAGMNQPEKAGLTPPIPNVAYHVAVNSQAAGPFDLTVLKLMIATGHFTANSLVWKQGMTLLEAAKNVPELNGLFGEMPPIPPIE